MGYDEETGKGGYHRVYKPELDETGYRKYLAKTVISSLMRDFPEETRAALNELGLSLIGHPSL